MRLNGSTVEARARASGRMSADWENRNMGVGNGGGDAGGAREQEFQRQIELAAEGEVLCKNCVGQDLCTCKQSTASWLRQFAPALKRSCYTVPSQHTLKSDLEQGLNQGKRTFLSSYSKLITRSS